MMHQKFFSGGDKRDLTFRYQCVNQKESNIIDHNKSQYTLSLQRSNYIKINDEVKNTKENPITENQADKSKT